MFRGYFKYSQHQVSLMGLPYLCIILSQSLIDKPVKYEIGMSCTNMYV